MNLYHCMIDLKDDAKAVVFAQALDDWLSHLMDYGVIGPWHLFRRKLNLSSDSHRDFILQIEVDGLAQLDGLFRYVSSDAERIEELHLRVHQMIGTVEFGLYRPYPDPARVERVAIL